MGQTLSYPDMEKRSETGRNARFLYSTTEMRGWRITMEDSHAAVLNLDEGAEKSNAFFAVYDGHGGRGVAEYAGENVHKRLISEEAYRESQYAEALKRAFLGTDEDMLARPGREMSGCTAVVALVTPDNELYVANAGDSRSVISVKGEVKPLSFDHKPTNAGETKRITAAGGYVELGRVNGNLSLSRALGDFDFKKKTDLKPEQQIITADPEITVHDISDEDEFFVLACDGIWDCLKSQEVVDYIRLKVSQGVELSDISEAMFEYCLAPDTHAGIGIGCDNMTIMIVALLNGRTKEEWYKWVGDRVKNGYGYETPTILPRLYDESRIRSFQAQRERRERWRAQNEERGRVEKEREKESQREAPAKDQSTLPGNITEALGGISFHPGSEMILSGTGDSIFGSDDSDDSNDEAMEIDLNLDDGSSDSSKILRTRPTGSILDRLAALERTFDNDAEFKDEQAAVPRQGEASPSLKPVPNGDASTPLPQFHSSPNSDEASPVVKAEGFLDSSDDPVKA